MKKILFFFLFILSFSICEAQFKTPMILDTIWVKDAIGNVDTVFIGADSAATSEIDPEFGEILLTHPFDSVFDIRLKSQFSFTNYFSKITIGLSEKILSSNNGCWSGGPFAILIHAKHQPVTVYWNRPSFANSICENGSFITDHERDALIWPFNWETKDTLFRCMSVEDSLIIDTSIPRHIRTDFEIEGKGEQTIYGVRIEILPAPYWGPCNALVSTKEADFSYSDLTIFPNPTNDVVNINLDFPKKVNVYDLQGKLVLKSIDTSQIDVSQLIGGVYFLEVLDRNSIRKVSKFIKM